MKRKIASIGIMMVLGTTGLDIGDNTIGFADGERVYASYGSTSAYENYDVSKPKIEKIYFHEKDEYYADDYDRIYIDWNREQNADGYYVYRKENNGAWKRIAITENTYYYDVNAEQGKLYYYSVEAYNSYNRSGYDKKGKKCVGLKTTDIYDIKINNTKSFTVKYKKISKSTGYQIMYSTRADFKKKYTKSVKSKSNQYTVKKLKSKKRYYVKIRGYKTIAKKNYYSEWSDVRTVDLSSAGKKTDKSKIAKAYAKSIHNQISADTEICYIELMDIDGDGIKEVHLRFDDKTFFRGSEGNGSIYYLYGKKGVDNFMIYSPVGAGTWLDFYIFKNSKLVVTEKVKNTIVDLMEKCDVYEISKKGNYKKTHTYTYERTKYTFDNAEVSDVVFWGKYEQLYKGSYEIYWNYDKKIQINKKSSEISVNKLAKLIEKKL